MEARISAPSVAHDPWSSSGAPRLQALSRRWFTYTVNGELPSLRRSDGETGPEREAFCFLPPAFWLTSRKHLAFFSAPSPGSGALSQPFPRVPGTVRSGVGSDIQELRGEGEKGKSAPRGRGRVPRHTASGGRSRARAWISTLSSPPWLTLSNSVRVPKQRVEECKARSSSFQTQPGHRVRETSAVANGLSWESRGSGRRWR